MLHHSFVCRILCYNAGIEDPQQLGRLEREYTDPTDARIFAIEYNPHSKCTQQLRKLLHDVTTSRAIAGGYMFVLSDASDVSESVAYVYDMHAVSDSLQIKGVWSPFSQVPYIHGDTVNNADASTASIFCLFSVAGLLRSPRHCRLQRRAVDVRGGGGSGSGQLVAV